jgi:hypothetical protein
VAGGSLADPTKPGPWITWQETDGAGVNQIFAVKPIGPGATNCNGVKPVAEDPNAAPAGGFCFQQVGVQRVAGDPTLNIDRTRDGVEPDIAFTGSNDSVPWIVWYEQNDSGVTGLHGNEMVFAAKGVAPGTPMGTVDGQLNFIAVGNTGQGILDNSGPNGGPCSTDADAEAGCSLNADSNADAEDPRVASGTMTPGNPTVPWVVWDEGNRLNPAANKVFVSRLVNGQFKIANGGQPVGSGDRPDITFSGNTPYVTWHNNSRVVTGHFVTPDQFVKDNAPVGTNASDEVRAPISSSCTANPFNQDGAACQGGGIGTPFFLFTDGDAAHAKLLADAYQTDAPTTGSPGAVGSSAAVVSGAVNPQGGPVKVQFQFGTTTGYGQATAAQKLGPANTSVPFSAVLTGLPASTTIHYRAVAITDFGTVAGADQTLKTAAPTDTKPPKITLKILKTTIKALVKAKKLKVKVTTNEASSVKLTASTKIKVHRHNRTVTLGKLTVKFSKAGGKTASIKLSKSGLKAIRHLRKVKIKVTGRATDLSNNHSTKSTSRTIKRR